MQFIIVIMAVFGCVTVLTSPAALAQTGKKLPIAIENFPPFEFEHNGKIIGFDTEIVGQVLERLGYIPDIKVLPWARAQHYAKSGKISALYSLTISPERKQFYYFSDPLSTVKDVFFKLKDKNISWKTMGDLKEYRIGISRGYTYAPVFMKALENRTFPIVDVVGGESPELRQLRKIKAGRTDLCIGEISVCQYLIKAHAPEFGMIDYIDQPIGEIRSYHIGFSKKWPKSEELVRKFNAELAKFVAEGRRRSIFQKYGVSSHLEKK